jgi:hypothetical protein
VEDPAQFRIDRHNLEPSTGNVAYVNVLF